jgi:hypothetical protein
MNQAKRGVESLQVKYSIRSYTDKTGVEGTKKGLLAPDPGPG